MPEELIIEHCSPTLAGIKTGSMFSVKITADADVGKDVRELNRTLCGKGLRVIVLKKTNEYALIYLYRPERLEKDLKDPSAFNILRDKGYDLQNPEKCIVQLVSRLKSGEKFPHEIGLFLGYPPSDVACFMKDPCEGVKCCGCWKAYSEPEKANDTFRKYQKCTELYREMNNKGKSLVQLAVTDGRALPGKSIHQKIKGGTL